MPELSCIVVTPEQTVCDKAAEFVAVTLYDGEIGIAPGHTPLIGRLGSGEMRITHGDTVERYYVEGGFVEVLGDTVTVLANRAVPSAQLDAAVARDQLAAALARPATTPEAVARRDRAAEQARAQLRIANRA